MAKEGYTVTGCRHEQICDYHWGERGSLTMGWGAMAPPVVQAGDTLYATTLCEPRWFLWRRGADGTWQRGADGPMLRPPMVLVGPDGGLTVIGGGIVWRSTEPGDFERLEPFCGMPHECRMMIYMGAAVNEQGDILIVFVNRFQEKQLKMALLPAGEQQWLVRSLVDLPVRYCYPQILFRGRSAAVFIVEDELVRDPEAVWGPNHGYWYRFREQRVLETDDVATGEWRQQEVCKQDDGFLHTVDIASQPDGSLHLLYWGYDRSHFGAPAPGRQTFLRHAVRRAPGEPFAIAEVGEGDVQLGTFAPDGEGGFHYLYMTNDDEPLHGYLGQKIPVGRLIYRHRGADDTFGPPQPVAAPEGSRPHCPKLLRPHRFGGTAPTNGLTFWWEDPWTPSNATNPHRTAWMGYLDFRAD